jgi:hypothetical protein
MMRVMSTVSRPRPVLPWILSTALNVALGYIAGSMSGALVAGIVERDEYTSIKLFVGGGVTLAATAVFVLFNWLTTSWADDFRRWYWAVSVAVFVTPGVVFWVLVSS